MTPPVYNKMACPRCGAAMNHHADKVDRAAPAPDARAAEPVFPGALVEVHYCPNCGAVATRPAPAPASVG